MKEKKRAITDELYDWTFDINVKGLLSRAEGGYPFCRMVLPSS